MYKIAIVDDDEFCGLAIQRFLRSEFEVSVFTSPSSFLREQCSYDLVIVDFSMPTHNYEKELNGRQLICLLKANLRNPPILVLSTGFVSESDLEIGRRLCPEADNFLTKDVGLEKILQEVKEMLASRQKES